MLKDIMLEVERRRSMSDDDLMIVVGTDAYRRIADELQEKARYRVEPVKPGDEHCESGFRGFVGGVPIFADTFAPPNFAHVIFGRRLMDDYLLRGGPDALAQDGAR